MNSRGASRSGVLLCLVLGWWAQFVQPASAQHSAILPDGLLQIYSEFSRKSAAMPTGSLRLNELKNRYTKQATDPAFEFLLGAYSALREEEFDKAIENFNKAVQVAPARIDIRKDLAYTYFKIGSNEPARQQFLRVMQLDPTDYHSALEVAFLDFEIDDRREKAEAHRIFDYVRQMGDPDSKATAQQAFQNIDGGLLTAIAGYQQAIKLDPTNLAAFFRLGEVAHERGEYELAINSYRAAATLNSGPLYIDLAEALQTVGRTADAQDALAQAARMSDRYTAERAKDLLQQLAGK